MNQQSPAVARLLKRAEGRGCEKPFSIVGTTGTGKYEVLALTPRGRIGVRYLGGGVVRIRVEPIGVPSMAVMQKLGVGGWKQPGDDGEHRFSVVTTKDGIAPAVAAAWKALGAETLVTVHGTTEHFKRFAAAAGITAKTRPAIVKALIAAA